MSETNIKNQLKQAAELKTNGNLKEAANIYRKILKTDNRNSDVLNLFGTVLVESGLHEQAINLFQRSIRFGGPNSGVLYNYGVALSLSGRFTAASRAFKISLEADSNSPECWFNLGITYQKMGNNSKALNSLKKAVLIDTTNAKYYLTLGNLHIDLENTKEAFAAYEASLQIDPNNFESLNNLGALHRREGNFQAAKVFLQRIIKILPDNAAALNNLGLTYFALKDFKSAENVLMQAINAVPNYYDASLNLADVYMASTEFEKAHQCITLALEKNMKIPDLWVKLGIIHQKKGELEKAKDILSRAKTLEKGREIAELALANVLRDLGEFETALSLLEKYKNKHGDRLGILINIGVVHLHQGNTKLAINYLKQAITIEPNNWFVHVNMAHVLLLEGDFENGWQEFQWRLKEPHIYKELSKQTGIPWKGQDVSNKTILVVCEQGIGDCFQFIRYVTAISARAKKTLLLSPPHLIKILSNFADGYTVISNMDRISPCDFHVPMLSLPYFLKLPFIPPPNSTCKLEKNLLNKWSRRFASPSFKVGICWEGSSAYETDYLRSITLDQFAPLFGIPTIDFIFLQKGPSDRKFEHFKNVFDLSRNMDKNDAFIDTAAVIMNLDLVITTDTAVAHLSGLLNKPVWLILSTAPDWRWQLQRLDTPWYPTMKLFRQRSPRKWNDVIAEIRDTLDKLVH